MNIKKITESVHYIGVNDRDKHRFEGMWPLPYGVSYNSYLVTGSEKTAIIDSVDDNSFTSLLHQLSALGVDAPDYLIINHMEPDHSGSIPLLANVFPQMKIVCSKLAVDMVGGFYGLTDPERFIIVKDGEELSLGDKTLRFITTPLVHWPETIMTYLAEERVLFTGDALGCFGAVNGNICDDDIPDTSIYFEEMYRYYSNIVGKYGKPVQAALAKLAGVEIEYACPTHGPVWHRDLAKVVEVYDRLSRYESEEGVVVVYASMYGNTAELADAIVDAMAQRGVKGIKVFNAAEDEMSDMISAAFRYKTLIVGSPTYSMTLFPPVEAFMRALQVREVKNKIVGAFGSFTWATGALPRLTEMLAAMNIQPAATLTMKQGFSEQTAADVQEFADKIIAAMKGNED